jgi:pimeloyl-ACP methyl ester carboxylesterase
MLHFLDALAIKRCVLRGHSDGAVIAALMGLEGPTRVLALILESCHFFRAKCDSRDFFQAMVLDPERFGERDPSGIRSQPSQPSYGGHRV